MNIDKLHILKSMSCDSPYRNKTIGFICEKGHCNEQDCISCNTFKLSVNRLELALKDNPDYFYT